MKAYIFPGQGAQTKGMGGDLFDQYPDLVSVADQILGYSIKELCLADPMEQLSQTQYTQPALYTVCCLSYLNQSQNHKELPDFLAGHSLGEYSALFAASVFDFETGLKLVQYRGQLMSQAQGGGMAAVIGLTDNQIHEILEINGLTSIQVANFNSLNQIVISGLKQDIEFAKEIFENSGASMYIPLKVSGAFHSKYMADAAEEFKNFIHAFQFSEPQIPVIANVDARPYEKETIQENLFQQMISSVQWVDTVFYLQSKGVEQFEEIGPGKVLTGLIQRIKRDS